MYDVQIGRRVAVDPLADERNWLSTCNYCQNMPINRIGSDDAICKEFTVDDRGYVGVSSKRKDRHDTADN